MKLFSLLALMAGLAGCAAIPGDHSVRNGETQSDVRAKLGHAAVERKLGSGDTAWYYVTGPSSFFTYRVVFASGGLVTDYAQVLTRKNFMALPQGAAQAAVLDELGPPMESMKFPRTATEAWNYRWLEDTFPMLADAVFDARNGALSYIVLTRDPLFTDSISPD